MGASTLAFFFLLFQCLLGIVVICRLDKGFYLQDIRLTFLVFFSLYALFWPAINLFFNIGPTDDSYVITIFVYGLALVPFNMILLWKRIRWRNTYAISRLSVRPNSCLVLLAGLVVMDVLIMIRAGVPVLLVFTLLASFLNRQVKLANININFWYLMFISLSMDFCRGDFTSISYTLFMMWLCLQICHVGFKKVHQTNVEKVFS